MTNHFVTGYMGVSYKIIVICWHLVATLNVHFDILL